MRLHIRKAGEQTSAVNCCKLWSFDSFRGLPPQASPEDEHRVWVEGSMSTGLDEFRAICRRNGISDDHYITVPGYYEDTIAQEDKIGLPLPNDVALAYIDCDLYSSTKTVLRFLSSRMKHGMILALDDYYCYSPRTLSGKRLACLEFLLNNTTSHPSHSLAGTACLLLLKIGQCIRLRSPASYRARRRQDGWPAGRS